MNGGKVVYAPTFNSVPSIASLPQVQTYTNPKNTYNSPFIYSVQIEGLTKGRKYYYKVDGSCNVYSFKIPDATYPMTVGLVADLGFTDISNASVYNLIAFNPDVVLFAGDLSYADGYGDIWDTWGNMMEPLAANVPIIATGGNHELSSAENWLPYFTRWPMPYKTSGSSNPCYLGKVVGKMHVVTLCSYAGFDAGSIQYNWAATYLAQKVDRTVTPWLVVVLHAPWYNSNEGHYMESELMRIAMEPLLYAYSVNIVVAGHVHVYERSRPSFNYQPDPCGMVYITIGDGGNYEGAYIQWRESVINGTDPLIWSAFRESSFGVAKLVLQNDTTASYTWVRYACDSGAGNSANPIAGDPIAYPSVVGTEANNWRQNFSSSCITAHDNSAQAMELVDETVITNTWQTCASSSRRLSAATEVKKFEKAVKVDKVFHKAQLKHEVEFLEAEVKGEKYVRPAGAMPKPDISPKKLTLEDSCGASSQIHLTIGDYPHHSVILSFASAIGPANGMDLNTHYLEVAYGTSATNLDMIAVSDHPQSYSSLPAITRNALYPTMGEPYLNFTDLKLYVDTTAWYS